MTKSVELTEKELFLLLKQKNENAFSYLYDQYAPLIYGVILREVKNSKVASEILKTTFLNIIDECKNLDCIKQSLFTWLLVIAKKTASTDFRVDFDLKSLMLPEKFKSEGYLQRDLNYRNQYPSPSSFLNLNRTV